MPTLTAKGRSSSPAKRQADAAGRGVRTHVLQGSGELLSPWRSEKCVLPFAHRRAQALERGSPLTPFHLPTAGAKGESCGFVEAWSPIAFQCPIPAFYFVLPASHPAVTLLAPTLCSPPTPQVVSSQPYAGDCRGAAALRLLSVLQYSVHPALEQLWSKRVPSLVEHIEGRRGLQPLLGSPSSGLLLGFAASQEWSGVLPRTVGLGILKLLEVVLPVLIGLLIALVPLIPTTSPCLGL